MNKQGWVIKKLGDICEIISGSTPKTNITDYWNGDYNWVTPAELNNDDDIIYKTNRKITSKAIKETNLKLLPIGTILLSSRAPIGKVAITGVEMYSNQGFKNLICSDVIFNRYLFRFLKGKTQYLNNLGRGATFKEISKEIVQNISIPVPPLPIQNQIVKELDTLQAVIRKKKKQLDELDKLAQATFYDMFGDPVENEKGWEIKCLSEVCNKITDGTHHSPKNSLEGDYPYITAKNIKKEGFDLSSLTYISKKDHQQIFSRCNPEKGDILYIKDGATTGIAQINTFDFQFSLLSSVALLKPNIKHINSYYLREYLNNNNIYQSIRDNMGGAAITRLTIKKIQSINILCPPLPLQNQFAQRIEAIEKQKALINQSIAETQLLFDSAMDNYFN